ncbi:MAG: GNAT family N-acetyltransferase [Polyangiaceae bacterium]
MRARRGEAKDVLDLRARVLRPGRPASDAHFAGDELATTEHWLLEDEAGAIVAVTTLMLAALPDAPASDVETWQLRGMAVEPALQGRGAGSALLMAALDAFDRARPPAIVWCNARVRAESLYARFGFRVVTGVFEIAGVGPHVGMVRAMTR